MTKRRPSPARTAATGIRRAPPNERAGRFVLGLLLCLALASPALAQSDAKLASAARRAPGAFDFFVLALSWSPGFCAAGGASKARSECAAGSGLGFVVHGLWPQFEHGFPTGCATGPRNPSRGALAKAAGLFPDDGLARYEWRKHGTCTGEAPADYFANTRRARHEIVIPAMFRSPKVVQKLAPAAVARAFTKANPRLRPGMLAVICRHSILEEVRFCLTKDLRAFRTCPQVVRASCRAAEISIPPIR